MLLLKRKLLRVEAPTNKDFKSYENIQINVCLCWWRPPLYIYWSASV